MYFINNFFAADNGQTSESTSGAQDPSKLPSASSSGPFGKDQGREVGSDAFTDVDGKQKSSNTET